jgi:hypothetical protein
MLAKQAFWPLDTLYHPNIESLKTLYDEDGG